MHKVTLSVNEIKKFLEYSKSIQSENELVPILNYIKCSIEFGSCTMLKMNTGSFVIHSFDTDEEDCEFVIDSKKLEDLISDTNKEKIIFTINNNSVDMYDGYFDRGFGIPDDTNYPSLPDLYSLEYTRIEKDVLDSLKSAKDHVGKDILTPYFMYVHFSDQYVYSANGQAVYIKKFSKQLPKISITPNECSLLSLFTFIDYAVSDRYNIYKFNKTTYGFLQKEDATPFQFMYFFNKVKKDNFIIVNVDDLIRFCSSTARFSPIGISTLKSNKTSAELIYVDGKDKNKVIINIRGNSDSFELDFLHSLWLPILRGLPYKEICISNEDGCIGLFNENDSNYLGIVSKIIKK